MLRSVVETHVVPLLAAVGEAYKVYTTSGVNDAGRTGQDIQAGHDGTPKVIIAAGDGTAHELMEGIFKGEVVGKWELAVLPMGTVSMGSVAVFLTLGERPSLYALPARRSAHHCITRCGETLAEGCRDTPCSVFPHSRAQRYSAEATTDNLIPTPRPFLLA